VAAGIESRLRQMATIRVGLGNDVRLQPKWWYGCGVVLWLVVAGIATRRFGASGGADLAPIYDAGRDVLHHRPIYAGGNFVYPPFMALAISPLSALRWASALRIWGIAQVLVPVAACGSLAAFTLSRCQWLVGSALLSIVLLKADVFANSLFLYNPTVLFALPAVLIAGFWSRGRWTIGAVVLGVSVALKPVLILLFLIPLVLRLWRPTAVGAVVAGALTLIGLVAGNDLRGFLRLPGQIADGTSLHGALLNHNVNLASVAQVHPRLALIADLARILVVVAFAAMVWAASRKPLSPTDMFVLAGGLALVLPLAGSLDEIHYSLLALPALPFLVMHRGHPVGRALGAIGILVLVVPLSNLGVRPLDYSDAQVRWCLGQLLVFFSCSILLLSVVCEPAA
jgi:arabinofuranan 3-O-arabinosyltransferase